MGERKLSSEEQKVRRNLDFGFRWLVSQFLLPRNRSPIVLVLSSSSSSGFFSTGGEQRGYKKLALVGRDLRPGCIASCASRTGCRGRPKQSAVFAVLRASPQHLHFTHGLRTHPDWWHGFNPFVWDILKESASIFLHRAEHNPCGILPILVVQSRGMNESSFSTIHVAS
jgi:hypothetical protein